IHQVVLVFDESHLHVHAYVFVEMARGVMFFSAIDRCDFEYSLQRTHHDLLVELRALRKKCFASEIIESEKLRSALGSGSHDLGRVYFGELSFSQVFAESFAEYRFDFENRANLRAAQRERAVVEHGGKRQSIDLALLANLNRQGLCGRRKESQLFQL